MLSQIKKCLKATAALGCLAATACTNPIATDGNYASPIGSSPVLGNPTPYSAALTCLGVEMSLRNVFPATITVDQATNPFAIYQIWSGPSVP